jgi:hypothetical protein
MRRNSFSVQVLLPVGGALTTGEFTGLTAGDRQRRISGPVKSDAGASNRSATPVPPAVSML